MPNKVEHIYRIYIFCKQKLWNDRHSKLFLRNVQCQHHCSISHHIPHFCHICCWNLCIFETAKQSWQASCCSFSCLGATLSTESDSQVIPGPQISNFQATTNGENHHTRINHGRIWDSRILNNHWACGRKGQSNPSCWWQNPLIPKNKLGMSEYLGEKLSISTDYRKKINFGDNPLFSHRPNWFLVIDPLPPYHCWHIPSIYPLYTNYVHIFPHEFVIEIGK